MWDVFAAAMLASVVVVLVPGALVLRALRLTRMASIAAAPLASMALFAVLANAYAALGIFCTWLLLLLSALALAAGAFLVSRAYSRCLGHAGKDAPGKAVAALASAPAPSSGDLSGSGSAGVASSVARCVMSWPGLAFYVVAGLGAMCWLYVGTVADASAFSQGYDNLHHLSYITSFQLTGNWSSFGESIYPDGMGANPLGYTYGFYPSAWYAVAALVAAATGCGVAIAENASLMAFAAVVFPAGMFLLMRRLFPDKPSTVFFGALCTVGFAFLPWRLISFAALYPQAVSLALLPAAAWAFIGALDSGAVRSRRLAAGAVFALGLVGIAFTQPNIVFALGVFLAPLIVAKVATCADGFFACETSARWAARIGFGALAAGAIALVWYACFRLPVLQSVVTYPRQAIAGVCEALGNVALACFPDHPAQPIMAVAIAAGILYCIVRRRKSLWLVASYALIALCYVASASLSGTLQQFFSGFWYNDYNRLAALVCLFAVPLASVGMGALSDCVVALVGTSRFEPSARAKPSAQRSGRLVPRACAVAVPCVLFLFIDVANVALGFAVEEEGANAFDSAQSYISDAFDDSEESFYSAEEQEFVEQVVQIVPDGAVIANIPGDGSAFAYAISEASVLYRAYDVINSDELASSVLLRTQLASVVSSQEVRDAARELGVEYVLLLDADSSVYSAIYRLGYSAGAWEGLLSIDEETPGFECVLSRGNMRLYRITALDAAA